ncbi:type I methionyl aminopeptidase [Gandjariella thermophila]|uniref:Methionine aminopeptidase n=1 Tax=Gandjariella thermophila TaxID=1931992 RepID=A0A4D4JBC7_9PSEU|nr:type I methionyl aminopeptidase [Gandjariella thermophila]GDY31958.1 methionine aminopeptidase [Gandjariella thermophila]
MIELKSDAELDAMREAGRVVATALDAVRRHATVGVSLAELDDLAATVIDEHGAKPSFLHYRPTWAPSPYPGVICTSVNDVVVHGIPDGYRLRDGDLVSIDCGAHVAGWHGDSAISFVVGEARPDDLTLIETTARALDAGIAAARPGARIGDIAHAVGRIGRRAGYGIPAELGGHGVGRAMHEAPQVPNDGRPGRGLALRPGMVIAIEPMFLAGGRDAVRMAPDGWAVLTHDGSRAAHVEHTVAVTDDGPRVLTALR